MNKRKIATFLALNIFMSGCAQIKLPTQPPPPSIKVDQKQLILDKLRDDSEWLSPASNCPADIMPTIEREIVYFDEECEKNAEGCLRHCKNNDANACYALALFIQAKEEKPQNLTESLFLRSCKLGIVSGCTNRAAGQFNLNVENAEEIECGARTFEKTCALNDPWGCTMYGFVLAHGKGVEQNFKKALEILPKGCSLGEEDPACANARDLEKQISEAIKNGTNKNEK
jgi:TPR repeat protein